MKKRKRRLLLCKILVFVLFFPAAIGMETVHARQPELYARSALLMDASNGRVLFEKNGYEVLPNASTTKIMTCMLAIEYMQENPARCENDPVSVSARAASMPKVHLGMREGEQYLLRDLLYSLMLESHNDTAVAIAEYVDGSVEAFADHMNEKAASLGCKSTHFVTPNGLDRERDGRWHETSAYDLGLMAAYALENDLFCEIIQTGGRTISDVSGKRQFVLSNKDAFLGSMEGACGIKTGFTAKAGYCFVGALRRDGKTLISVVLACGWPPNKSWKWADTRELMQYGLSRYELKSIQKDFSYETRRIPVEEGVETSVGVYLDADMELRQRELCMLLCDEDRVEVTSKLSAKLAAPVEAGTVVGYELYELNGKRWRVYPIKCKDSVKLRSYTYCLQEIFMVYFIRM